MYDRGVRLLRRGDYIGGSFVRPVRVDGYIVGINPGDRTDTLGRFAFSATSVDDAVGAAREAVPAWRRTHVDDRADLLVKLAERLEEDAVALAELLTRETGKPLWESAEEVSGAARSARLLAREGPLHLPARRLKEGVAWSEPQPHGVVAVITPAVFPLLVPTLHVLAALLAGNTVVFKPSKFAPGAGQALAERLDRCKLPRGVFNLVQGSGSVVGQRIVAHPGVDALLFAGSYATAKAVRAATVDRPELPLLYQCGGKSTAIVLADADLPRAAYDLSVSAFITAGQRHNGTARILVHRDVLDAFAERFAQRARELVLGYGFDDGVFMGPVVSDAARIAYRRYGKALTAAGHTPLLEATPADVAGHKGFYVRPALYWMNGTERDGANLFLDEEPPGPIVQLYPFDDVAHAARLHNRVASRSTAAVFGDPDGQEVAYLLDALSTGSVHLNRGTIGSSLRLPAVGMGRASNGVSADSDLLRFLAVPRAVLVDRSPFDASRRIPGTGFIDDHLHTSHPMEVVEDVVVADDDTTATEAG